MADPVAVKLSEIEQRHTLVEHAASAEYLEDAEGVPTALFEEYVADVGALLAFAREVHVAYITGESYGEVDRATNAALQRLADS